MLESASMNATSWADLLLFARMLTWTCIVTLAFTTPALQPLMPDAEPLLAQVAVALRPWTCADSSAEMIAGFVQLIRQKLRLFTINRVDTNTNSRP